MRKSIAFPTGKITSIKGTCIVLKGDDIDTDRIIPARFLKCVNFENLGSQVFADDRKEKKGLHPFDQNANKGASILIVNRNFGCGSSREHAPQSLMRWGVRAIIGISFAEIFQGNCLSLGIPCGKISENDMVDLENSITNNPTSQLELEIHNQTIELNQNKWSFSMEKGSAAMLISGNWDATSTLINEKEKINNLIKEIPYLNGFED